MASRTAIFALVVLSCLALASAQCIECKDCKGSNACLSMCKASCAPTVNVENCKNYGNKAGQEAAQFACELTMNYCDALIAPKSARSGAQQVSLQQCGNAVYGSCQSTAFDQNKSPCGKSFNGVRKCNRDEFRKFYDMVVNEQCNNKASVFEQAQPTTQKAQPASQKAAGH